MLKFQPIKLATWPHLIPLWLVGISA